MKILVTGAGGLLGQKLTALLDADQEVEYIATARNPLLHPLKRGRFILLDITRRNEVERTLTDVQPEAVIHTAAMTQVDQCETKREACWHTNAEAIQYWVEGCKKVGSHFIHLSTDFIFDGSNGLLNEQAIPNPVNYYGESKLDAENTIQSSTLDWTIIRTALVYGTVPSYRPNIVLWIKKTLEENGILRMVNDQWRTPTLSEDLAIGCCLIAKGRHKGLYHISGEEVLTPYEMAVRTAHFFHLNPALIKPVSSTTLVQQAKRPRNTCFIIKKAKHQLLYRPHTFHEGLTIMSAQMQSSKTMKG